MPTALVLNDDLAAEAQRLADQGGLLRGPSEALRLSHKVVVERERGAYVGSLCLRKASSDVWSMHVMPRPGWVPLARRVAARARAGRGGTGGLGAT